MTIMLTYTDANWIEIGSTSRFALDLAFGNDENSFEVQLPSDISLESGSLVYVDGTEFGGIVRKPIESHDGMATAFTYFGETWHGIIGSRCLRPEAGKDWLTASGEANSVLASLVARTGLGDIFSVSSEESSIEVSHQFERFEDAYSGIRKMLAKSSAKLRIEKQPGSKPVLSAVSRDSYIDETDASRYSYEISDEVPINHMICLGKGDLAERIIVDLYADADGNVSRTQSIFGRDYRQYVYELSSAEESELIEKGTEKLTELQRTFAVELGLPDEESFDVGDVVGVVSSESGRSITADVTKVIVKSDDLGGLIITNEIGEVTASSARFVSSGSAGSGSSYTAGDGIEILGGVIRAQVTPSMLAGVDEKSNEALTAASNASAAVGATIKTVDGDDPISVSTVDRAAIISHAASDVAVGSYGPASNLAPSFGDTVTMPPQISVNKYGHVTQLNGRTLKLPSTLVTDVSKGLMSASDKTKLDGIDDGANHYEHPTGSGSEHIPSGGKAGQILGWLSDGYAQWVDQTGASAAFLQVWHKGMYLPSDGTFNPNDVGGTWEEAPSLGPHWWHRID